MYILVVDDSQTERARLSGVIKKIGHSVDTANNGKECLKSVENKKPDVIFMDVNMPEMDGFAATRALKSDAATKGIPIIMVTSKDQKADKAWGRMLGAKAYITKPYPDEEVTEVLNAL